MSQQSILSRETIPDAFQKMSDEICLFGGTVTVLAFSTRRSTRDVDAIFQPVQLMRVEGLFAEDKI